MTLESWFRSINRLGLANAKIESQNVVRKVLKLTEK